MPKITLKAARTNAGLSQREAAKILNVSNKTLCNWEKGRTYPKQNKIEEMCQLYHVEYNQLNFLCTQ